jgi:hypothetical protein
MISDDQKTMKLPGRKSKTMPVSTKHNSPPSKLPIASTRQMSQSILS